MSKVPTAEEFIRNEYDRYSENLEAIICNGNHVEFMMQEFAKLHIQAQAEAIIEQIKTRKEVAHFPEGSYEVTVVDKESILNAYPLTNIK